MTIRNKPLTFGIVCICAALSGCGSTDQDQLRAWMAEQRGLVKSRVDRIPDPTKFSPQAYTQEAAVEPFSNQKLAQAVPSQHEPVTEQGRQNECAAL